MKYTKAINIDEPGVDGKIRSGELKLQPGQWVVCGCGRPSRFAGATETTIYASHPQGDRAPKPEHFRILRDCAVKYIEEEKKRKAA